MSDGSIWEVGTFSLGGTGAWQRVELEEEQSRDGEIAHVDETLHVLALGKQVFAQQVTHNGGDTTALRRLAPSKDAPMEWGLIRGIDHNWQTLPFAKIYTDPVLVAKPTSNRGGDPGAIRLANITAKDAELSYQEWNYLDGWHIPEDVFYLVSEAGVHGLGALTVEADWLISNRHPTVVGDVDSTVGGDPVSLRYVNPTNAQIQLKLAEEQSGDTETGHVMEDVGVFVGE